VDGSAEIIGGVQQFIHKLLNIGFVNPGGTQPHLDFRGFQILGLGGPEGVHVASVHRVLRRNCFRLPELLPDIAGQILVRCYPAHAVLCIAEGGVMENHTPQF
jgi:hypothetical protein